MTTALSKAEASAFSVSYDVGGNHVELDMDFVRKYLVRGRSDFTSDQEVVLFLNTCKSRGLNPLSNGEVYLIKYAKDDPAQIVVGLGAYLSRAFDNPDYMFKRDGITVQRGEQIVQKEGCCLYPGEVLLGGWCCVHFKRHDQEMTEFKEVSFSEYNKGMANWKTKPATMINKVAVSQCIRSAFPKDYKGIYSEEELIASGAIPSQPNYVELDESGNVKNPENDNPIITQQQRRTLFATAQKLFGKEEGNNSIKSILETIGIQTTTEMRESDYTKAMNMMMEMATPKTQNEPEEEGKDAIQNA